MCRKRSLLDAAQQFWRTAINLAKDEILNRQRRHAREPEKRGDLRIFCFGTAAEMVWRSDRVVAGWRLSALAESMK